MRRLMAGPDTDADDEEDQKDDYEDACDDLLSEVVEVGEEEC